VCHLLAKCWEGLDFLVADSILVPAVVVRARLAKDSWNAEDLYWSLEDFDMMAGTQSVCGFRRNWLSLKEGGSKELGRRKRGN
jgi:hypothetical protein